jgi:CxxC motif-containing protein (DUF1111 family)
VDLNLLTALDVLLTEGSVTGAARRLGLSSSAMSRTLTRLRVSTSDPLLVRAGRGLVPTPHAAALRDRVQNKSIMIFAGEAYNVEMGVTNDLFAQATDESPACSADKSEPNDIFRNDPSDARNQSFYNPLHELPDWQMFAIFMRFLEAPQPVAFSASAQRGQQLFGTDPSNQGIGCFACHTPTMVTPAKSETEALQNLTVHPYSDLLIHHMGKGLADDITQGAATGDMFRTTPLWGVGQRTFFLHNGRTSDLLNAIHAHHSAAGDCDDSGRAPCYGPSEANTVINRFDALSEADKQAILDFLRSL